MPFCVFRYSLCDFITNFSKRYKLFPWNNLKKVAKIDINSQVPISVRGTDYTVKELSREVERYRIQIQMSLKASSYNPVLKAFIKQSFHVPENEIKDVYLQDVSYQHYLQYKEELHKQFDDTREKLIFCLEGLKVLNKQLKNLPVKESEEFIMNRSYYENYLNDIESEIIQENESASLSEAQLAYYEAYLDMVEAEVLTEGANIDNFKTSISMKKEYVNLCKEYKKQVKDAKFTEAKKTVKDMKKLISDTRKEIKSDKGGIGSTILGLIANSILTSVKCTLITLPATIAINASTADAVKSLATGEPVNFVIAGIGCVAFPVKMITQFILSCKEIITQLIKIIENISEISASKEKDSELYIDALNLFKNKILIQLDELDKTTDKFDEHIDKVEEKYNEAKKKKEEKEVKEFAEMNDFEKYKFVNENGELEDFRELQIQVLESLLNEDEDDDYEDDDEFVEGANRDTKEVYKTYGKEIKYLTKKYKKCVRSKDYAGARKALSEMRTNLDRAENEIEQIDDEVTFGSMIKGWILNYFHRFFRCLIAIIPIAGPIYLWYKEIKDDILNIIQVITDLIDGDLTPDSFNWYRNRIKFFFKEARSNISKLERNLKRLEDRDKSSEKASEKEEEEVKESQDYEAEKLAIYEACQNGDITIEEREELLFGLKDKKYIEKASEYEVYNEVLSNKEKFNQVRKALYEKCNSGEISVTERENLILKAREMIFESNDNNDSLEGMPPAKKAENNPEKITKEVEKNIDKAAADISK